MGDRGGQTATDPELISGCGDPAFPSKFDKPLTLSGRKPVSMGRHEKHNT
jgi:hypothetical protein